MTGQGPIRPAAGPAIASVARYRMLLEAMRPWQWSKNTFVLAGVLFSGRMFEAASVGRALGTFAAFCAVSSASYLFNDVRDRERDRLNPRTAGRPLARGDIGTRTAMTMAVICAVFALAVGALVNVETLGVIGGFAAIQVGYSLGLKHIQFIDVMTIATGFLLRALGGLVCIDAELSPWLLLATGLLALFLGLAKRRGELVALGAGTHAQRPVLAHYSVALLDELIAVVTPCIVMVYALYCVLQAPSDAMLITLPPVLYGIFRVLSLIHHHSGVTEDPAVLAVRDRPLLACVILWGVVAGVVAGLSF